MPKIERRYIFELRAESQGDEMSLVGYASKFNTPSEDLGGFRETVLPGAFARSIREARDVKCTVNHDPSMLLGRTKNGTLKLEEDGTGLKFRCVLPNTQTARDLHTLVKRGDMDSCSFAFIPREQSWENVRSENGDLYANRKLHDVDLEDVSVVTSPAYPHTEVMARALFPDGEPVEVRGAIDAARRASNKDGFGVDAKTPDAHKDAKKKHRMASAYHEGMQRAHGEEGSVARSKGDIKGAAGHMLAMMTHDMASRAHDNAAWSHGNAAEATNESSSADAHQASRMAHEITSMAEKATDRCVGMREGFNPAELRMKIQTEAEKRGSEANVPELTAISLPQPFDSDMKQAWWNDFMDAYKYAVKRLKYRDKEAVAYALGVANKEVQPKTDVDPEVAGQAPNRTKLTYQIVDTDGTTNGDDDKGAAASKENPNQNRDADAEVEKRVYKSTSEVPSYVPADKKSQWKEVWNSAYKAAIKDGKSAKDAEAKAFAEANGVAGSKGRKGWKSGTERSGQDYIDMVSDPDSPDYNPDDEAYDPDWAERKSGKKVEDAEGDEAQRAGKKTKKVAGKQLTSDKFAWVGDPNDPSTWKLPIHDEAHARNALARFNQTQGIPADKKDAVYKKIVAAAKKFGIDVSEEKSFDAELANRLARSRMIQIDVEL